jgi:hypothetical protein
VTGIAVAEGFSPSGHALRQTSPHFSPDHGLRSLPPVAKHVPLPSPPRADDCAEYTFFLVPSRQPGCG